MLNYLSAELWRMFRRGADKAGWLVFLLLTALAGLLWSSDSPSGPLEVFQDLLVVGLYVALPLAAWANGEAARTDLLANEVAFGLPRSRIYLGKLCGAVLAGLLLFLLTALVFLGVALPLAVRGGWGTTWEVALPLAAWSELGEVVLCALPRYIGAAALAHFLIFSLRPAGLGAVLYYLYLIFGELTLSAVRFQGLGRVGAVLNVLGDVFQPLLLSGPYFSGMPPAEVGQSWLVGAVWTVAASAAGIALFRRREIR